jgi:heptosyltransferase III
MTVLLIKPMHIGDALLLTPTVKALRKSYPAARLVVVVRDGCQGILAGCGEIDEIVVTKSPAGRGSPLGQFFATVGLLRQIRKLRADYSFELGDNSRGFWLTALSGAKRRCINDYRGRRAGWWRALFTDIYQISFEGRHRVHKDHDTVSRVLALPGEPSPLVFDEQLSKLPENIKLPPRLVVIHAPTRWQRKSWPRDKWVALARQLLDRGYGVFLSCGPDADEVRLNGEIVSALGGAVQSSEGLLGWSELAAVLHRADLFVGVDTAATHLAAACQCPTVALFGATKSSSWGPWGVAHEIVLPIEARASDSQPAILTADITVTEVTSAIDRLEIRCRTDLRDKSGLEPREKSTDAVNQ